MSKRLKSNLTYCCQGLKACLFLISKIFDYLVVDTILQSYILATFFFQFQCPLSAANTHPSPIRQCLSYVLLMMNWQLFGRIGCSNIYYAFFRPFFSSCSLFCNSQSQISDGTKIVLIRNKWFDCYFINCGLLDWNIFGEFDYSRLPNKKLCMVIISWTFFPPVSPNSSVHLVMFGLFPQDSRVVE